MKVENPNLRVENVIEEKSMIVPNDDQTTGGPTDNVSATLGLNGEAFNHDCDDLAAPRDTGYGAWKALSGAILYNAILVGFPLTFGVFQQYFQDNNTFGFNAPTAWVGVISGGVPYLGAPLMTYVCQRYNVKLRYYLVIGWLLCVIGLVAGAFCTSLGPLAATQGLCYAIGIFILDVPTLLVLNSWFLKRRGLAYGLLFAMTDLLGFILSYIANALLLQHGFKITMLVFAAIIAVIPGSGIWLLTERVIRPERRPSSCPRNDLPQAPLPEQNCGTEAWIGEGLVYYRRPIFYILSTANLFQAFGFYIPFIYIASYATDLGHTPLEATTVLAVANLAQIIGEFTFGKISDLLNVRGLCVLGSSLGASLATFFLWGFARSYAQLLIFAIVYGAFASGLISLWARIGTFFGEDDAQKIYSVMSFGRGIGNIASGPISAALLQPASFDSAVDRGAYALGKYQKVVLFVGACMCASALMGAVGFVAVAIEERTQSKTKKTGASQVDLAGKPCA